MEQARRPEWGAGLGGVGWEEGVEMAFSFDFRRGGGCTAVSGIPFMKGIGNRRGKLETSSRAFVFTSFSPLRRLHPHLVSVPSLPRAPQRYGVQTLDTPGTWQFQKRPARAEMT